MTTAHDLGDELALVTGATRGIGRAIALALATRGARVVGTATSEEGAQAISDAFATLKLSGEGRVLDVGEPDSVDELVRGITQDLSTPTILVNNAGITRDNLLMRMKDDEWDTILRVNLTSVYRLCKACLRGMIKARHGRIVNITSVVGLMGNSGQTNYAAAKAGMLGFTRSLAREVASRGITVNAVAPGFIETDMTNALDEGQREALLKQIPLARLGRPEEVAAAVAFLCSRSGGYVTGETLNVNGGMLMV